MSSTLSHGSSNVATVTIFEFTIYALIGKSTLKMPRCTRICIELIMPQSWARLPEIRVLTMLLEAAAPPATKAAPLARLCIASAVPSSSVYFVMKV